MFMIRPVEISPETLALEAIQQVGPGGHFLEAQHTLRHYREAHFLPQLSQRQTYEQWQSSGAKGIRQRANERCRQLLADYTAPPIEAEIVDRLDDFIERRKAEKQSNELPKETN